MGRQGAKRKARSKIGRSKGHNKHQCLRRIRAHTFSRDNFFERDCCDHGASVHTRRGEKLHKVGSYRFRAAHCLDIDYLVHRR